VEKERSRASFVISYSSPAILSKDHLSRGFVKVHNVLAHTHKKVRKLEIRLEMR